ncbi:helix-turn-helix domain-containing protein [Pseudomonas aeruginosa]|uniref:helix-turn-helix domain-containing protein n=1 Tax=Pseudomonas aeruginosa TaxID=287 RepID=UPI000F521191|nr:helix-turn-helix transcriptional regulator [Pseudomonas aeruginosa]MDI3611444.1 helix-turn-helix transcriptional regulator [Pseudomonas aeruginosa]MDI4011863.1 helix-turn-helix transcriptional regulator [Pseudomonas aeruginosa]MDI4024795.1 helix-turn-helix transcriptional regulator [Pseudomonas aeruginosa]RPL43516.1 transcriptional regulator [Pseudomonas aeruginosa]RPY72104.1 transcriptional regulator [Pseudomonas aeruginosa]
MEVKDAFGAALRLVRRKRGLTQEDFSLVSSRTFVSMLERGATAPTIEKIEDLCSVLAVHPTTLFAITYLIKEGAVETRKETLKQLMKELDDLLG